MSNPMTLTADMLREGKACGPQVELFEQTFGQSAQLTPENMRKAIAAGLNVIWYITLITEKDWNDACEEAYPGFRTRKRRVMLYVYRYGHLPTHEEITAYGRSLDRAESVALPDHMIEQLITDWENWIHAGCPPYGM